MRKLYISNLILFFAIFAIGCISLFSENINELKEKAEKLYKEGNYNDALEIYKKLLSGKVENPSPEIDFEKAISCFYELKRVSEIDEFRENVISNFKENWKVLWQAGGSFFRYFSGQLIDGKFVRGQNGVGKIVSSYCRDRVRGLQLFFQAYEIVSKKKDVSQKELYDFLISFAYKINFYYGLCELQELTDISTLPDYEEFDAFVSRRRNRFIGVPVDKDGNPVYFSIPASLESAKSDGERWRFLLHQASLINPEYKAQVDMIYAKYLLNYFGVQTIVDRLSFRGQGNNNISPYVLSTLSEDETVARLASGIKRFKMPEEHNYIKIMREVSKSNYPIAQDAFKELAQIFQNRMQYTKAVECLQEGIKRFGNKSDFQEKLMDIIGDWGTFLPEKSFPAGKNPVLRLRYKNAKIANFEAYKLKVEALINDIKEYLKSNPSKVEWRKIQLDDLGRRFVLENEEKYIGEKVAEWQVNLNPKEGYYDKIDDIEIPVSKAGAYLITAKIGNGNTARITLVLNDTIIFSKTGNGSYMYFLADAVTGKPLSNVDFEIFTFESIEIDKELWTPGGRRYNVITESIKAKTDSKGIAILRGKNLKDREYLFIVRGLSGGISYLGFEDICDYIDFENEDIYNESKAYLVTDRPVYRPGDEVNFKIWLGRASYEKLTGEFFESEFAGEKVNIRVYDSFDEKIYDKENLIVDKWGGVNGKFKLKEGCNLGTYRVSLGGNSFNNVGFFRVEEYKKPEFEVNIEGPEEPVTLGEKIKAKVKAKYYFGEPVTNAIVRYKVERYQHDPYFFVPHPWDWLYGRGYWWQGQNYEWYRGWIKWEDPRRYRCMHYFYEPPQPQPELIVENEVPIGKDGTAEIIIDSSMAKDIYGEKDQRYEITAEVVDASRRVIYTKGSCIAAAKPFRVIAWIDSGWGRPGEIISAKFAAQTPDGKAVKGNGKLSMLKLKYDKNGDVSEELIQSWNLETDEEGRASIKIKAPSEGQYCLSYVLERDGKKEKGVCIFNVFGDEINDNEYRFNDLEIISAKSEYNDNEKALFRINTKRKNSFVFLFVKPVMKIYPEPILLELKDGTAEYEIAISKNDMPNFFLEAITIADGKLYRAIKEVFVPPAQSTLNVEIIPDKEKYKPGEQANATIRITDLNGIPLANSSVVISIYDKALEYISAGSNVPDIREFFWKWSREIFPRTFTNISNTFFNILKGNEKGFPIIGVFGNRILDLSIVDDEDYEFDGMPVRKYGGSPLKRGFLISEGLPAATMEAGNNIDQDGVLKDIDEIILSDARLQNLTVRKEFKDTAFWLANLTTNENGEVFVKLNMPENLTTWKVKVWTLTSGTRVGQGEKEVITSKNFIIRPQAPRFFIQNDKVTLSAIVHNYHNSLKNARVIIELNSNCLMLTDKDKYPEKQEIQITEGEEKRVDWNVYAVSEGEAIITMKTITDDDSDAVETKIPVYVHGILKTESFTSTLKSDDNYGKIEIQIPEDCRSEESVFEIRYSPTLAITILDALPYLSTFPYECTEQTLNRFLPLIIAKKTLLDIGVNLEEIANKKRELISQQITNRDGNYSSILEVFPMFDKEKFDDLVSVGLKRIQNMQLSDGGWGWFSGYGEYSDAHTTAIVVHGLIIAKNNGIDINRNVLQNGLKWLENYQKIQLERLCKHNFESGEKCKESHPQNYKMAADDIDALVYYVLAEGKISDKEMTRILYRDRNHLRVYGKTLFALGLFFNGEEEKLAMLKRNISQYLVLDNENETAYLDLNDGKWFWWYWHGNEIEANGFYLKLLSLTEPKSEISPKIVKYLLNNRKNSTYWTSTRDTAYCIEAITDFIRTSKENKPDIEIEVIFDGKTIGKQKINEENLFTFNNLIKLKGKELNPGKHKLEFKKTGKSPLYCNSYLTYFTTEEFITKTGLDIKVRRNYYKLLRKEGKENVPDKDGQIVKEDVEKYTKIPIKNYDILKSGDLVEVELVIETKNDYEYLVFEDMKPAGFETCEIRSGYNGNEMNAFLQFRDEKVLFFVRRLPRGVHSVSYRVRAEVPGVFSALPVRGSAMYAPELKANSDEIKIKVED